MGIHEEKAFPAINYKAANDSDRVRTGFAAVFGNIDDGGDITHPGAFAKTLNEGLGRKRFKHLWNHNSGNHPIATIVDIKEIGVLELPEEIRRYAPEATGGLMVKRDYYPAAVSALAELTLFGIDKGDINEMSYAYDAVKTDFGEIDGRKIRNLREVILFDTSDVIYGMNPATVAIAAKGLIKIKALGEISQDLALFFQEYLIQLKTGSRNSASDTVLLNSMLQMISSLLGMEKAEPSLEEVQEVLANENEAKEEKAEAVVSDTSLSALKQSFNRLKINNLKT